ncbi:MAG: hypothetical protein KAI86_04675 [Desulfobacterales bacterium]|nr:hypothetical protein [Desulfobacterales bacterium]
MKDSKWKTMKECSNCNKKVVIHHDEDDYPEFCPFCGLNKYGAAAEQVCWPEEPEK